MNTDTKQRPFGLRDKIGYASGDFGNDFAFVFANTYLTVFYTDVLGMAGTLVGTLFLLARFVDAFTDVTMGRICDTCEPTKDGRFRRWIKIMAVPMGIASMLMYLYFVRDWPYGARVAYMFITYIFWGSFVYTACNIPYGCLASVISNDPKDRASLSTYRTVGAVLCALIVGMVTPRIVYGTNADGQSIILPEKLTMMAVIYGIFAAVFYLVCYKMTTERVVVPTKKKEQGKESFFKTYKELFTCRPLLIIIIIALLLLLGSLLGQTMNTYLYKDYFNNTKILSLVSLASMLPMILCAPFATKLSDKFGKKEVCAAGMLVASAVFFILWILKLKNPMIFILMTVITGIGMGLLNMLIWAFIGDVIDYQEIRTNERIDGAVYSLYSFARKVGQALAGGIGGYTLTLIGYVSSTTGVEQTESVKMGIYNCATIVPALCYFAIFLLLLFVYPLGKKQVDENVRILAEKRALAK